MDLSGVTVLDLTRLLPGPYATQLLADAGAEVLKVERPGRGEYGRAMALGEGPDVFSAVNRGKRSITFDLKQDESREALLAIATDVDVVVESFRPGVVERLGIDYEDIRAVNDDVIYCSMSGFGASGPYRDRAGHDLNYIALSGLLDMTRAEDDGRPAIPGFPIADMAGGLMAAFGIVSALLSRELGNSGGEHLDIAMTDAVLSFSQAVAPQAFAGDDPTGRETPLTGEYPCYDVYQTADGRYVTLAALEPPFWEAFCEHIDREDLLGNHLAQDRETREETRAAIAGAFVERTRDEWEEILGETDVMFAPVLSLSEALASEHAEERGVVTGAESQQPRVGLPVQSSAGTPTFDDESIPDVGEHTEAVLETYGYTSEEIAALRDANAI